MVPLKPLLLCSLLFILAGCLQMRNDAPGVRLQEESVVETDDDDDCSTDEEQNTIQERMTNNKISDDELKSISSEIWNSVADLDVIYDGKQDKKGNRKLFDQREVTYKAIDETFKNLLPFYEKSRGIEDPCVSSNRSQCRAAQGRFLKHIFEKIAKKTEPIEILHDNLKRHGIFKGDYGEFAVHLKTIWFTPHNRPGGTVRDSSAFEHVFLGEITRNGAVTGLHNWMRMYIEERGNHFKLNKDPIYGANSQPIVANVNFTWYGHLKTASSFFMRKSPAVEIALYTLCFMARPDKQDCWLKFGAFTLNVKTIPLPKNKSLICTAFPVIPPRTKTY